MSIFSTPTENLTADGSIIRDEQGRFIGSACGPHDRFRDEINARLWASAPDLLAALKSMVALQSDPQPGLFTWSGMMAQSLDSARSAIARAEGRES